MTEFMVTTIVLAIIGALTYLIAHNPTGLFEWLLFGFIIVLTLTAVYGYLYMVHHPSEEEE